MGFREMVKKVQVYSGFSDKESQAALECTIAVLASLLIENERKDFASQLPPELQKVVLHAVTTTDRSEKDILSHVVERQGIDQGRAKKQLLASWHALKDAISPGEIEDIRAQLTKASGAFLY